MSRGQSRRSVGKRGFTLVELAAVVVTGAAGAGCLMAMGGGNGGQPPAQKDGEGSGGGESLVGGLMQARAQARQLKDAAYIRGIVQSMVVWAANNKGKYPLPGDFDTANATVAVGEGENAASQFSKNQTGHILSVLIFNGSISTELCVSPAEVNKRIKAKQDYMFTNPKSAPDPVNALWDPSFSADFTSRRPGGNVSYAHLQPSKNRRKMWSDTFSSSEAVFANRAPQIVGMASDDQGDYAAKIKNEKSKTYRIHGDPKSWEGNIAFNDGHVDFETRLSPKQPDPPAKEGVVAPTPWATYQAKNPMKPGESVLKLDCYFYDEPDDAGNAANLYLGIFTKAGDKASEFRGIWD